MKIAVIGATGKAGRLIAKEAKSRGYKVTAVTRASSVSRLEDDYPVLTRDIFDLTTDDLRAFDVVVDAFGTDFSKPGNEYLHVTSVEHLIEVMEPLQDVRLFVIGGAGSLFKDESRTKRVLEFISPSMRAVPEASFTAYKKLLASKVNYSFMSPAETFDAGGPRTGKYTLGTDVAIKNTVNRSYITYADYAVAMVDEFENKQFVRQRFTAVSEAKYKNDAKNEFVFGPNAFTRYGAYFGVYAGPGTGGGYGGGDLYIGSRRGIVSSVPNNRLINIYPIHDGKKVPYAVMATATELLLRTQYGNLRVCMAEDSLMMIKGENGLGLRMNKQMVPHEIMKPRGDKAWEGAFRWVCCMVFNPLKGRIDMDAKWDWEKLTTPIVKGDVLPDENGEFLLAIEEFTHAGWLRDRYPTYEDGLADVTQDFESFLAKQPDLPLLYADERREAAYMTWSHIVSASGQIKRPFVYMMGTSCASAWQMCENAVALKNNLPLAIELMINMIDQQSPTGQLPDLYDDMKGGFTKMKPPVQGWALDILMREHDFESEVPRDKLEYLYEGYARWADWFPAWRDDDEDGVYQYDHGDDSGNDDAAVFKYSLQMELPDLNAFVALLCEKLGDIARILGRGEAVAEGWYRRSKQLIDAMIRDLWNGERFVAHVSGTHRVVDNTSIMFYRPLVLGSRLPQEILDKMAADLSEEGGYLTPYGLNAERITSVEFNKTSFGNGGIPASENLLIATGLYDSGKVDLAKKIAKRYCDGVKLGGSPFFGAAPGFMGSWGAASFQVLANLCCNM